MAYREMLASEYEKAKYDFEAAVADLDDMEASSVDRIIAASDRMSEIGRRLRACRAA